jgi:hypothetical protein
MFEGAEHSCGHDFPAGAVLFSPYQQSPLATGQLHSCDHDLPAGGTVPGCRRYVEGGGVLLGFTPVALDEWLPACV